MIRNRYVELAEYLISSFRYLIGRTGIKKAGYLIYPPKCLKCQKDDKTVVENIPLVESTAPNVIEILHTGDKVTIQDLIRAENSENTAVIR